MNFLSDRTQHVRINNGKTSCNMVIDDVPQSFTVLGSASFLVVFYFFRKNYLLSCATSVRPSVEII